MDANTTIAQMGGRGIFAMTFKSVVTDGNHMTFRIAPRLSAIGGAMAVHVILASDDTYTVRTTKMYGAVVSETTGVYCDNLRQVIESMTGLYLGL